MTASFAPWLRAAIVAGVVYLVDGLVFSRIPAAPGQLHAVRLASWLVGALAFAIHVGYERRRLGSSHTAAALHAAIGCAIGGFGLAAAALIRAWVTHTGYPQRLALALVVWPVLLGVPGFVTGLIPSRLFPTRAAAGVNS